MKSVTKAPKYKHVLTLLCLFVFVQLNGRTLSSSGVSLDFSDKNAWIDLGTGVAPASAPKIGSGSYDDVIISHDLTYTGNLDFKGGSSLTVNAIGSLTITGNLKSGTWGAGNAITNNGTITVGGDVTLSSPSTFSNAGTLNADDFTLTTGNSHTNSGDIILTGAFLHNGSGTFSSTGGNIITGTTFTVGTNTSTANISGTNISVGTNLATSGSGRIILSGDSEVNVSGNFTSTGSVSTVFSGTVNIAGNVAHSGSSALTFNGSSNVGGNFSATGPSPVSLGGTLGITGTLTMNTGGNITGTGILGWGSINVDGNSGTTFIACSGGTRYDSSPGWPNLSDPPANPLNLSTCAIGALPVELIEFNVHKAGETINLSWITASELNTSHFEVLKSYDGEFWETIDYVSAQGNTNRISQYSSLDGQFSGQSGQVYYKLKVVDLDGTFLYSELRRVGLDGNQDIYVYDDGTNLIVKIETDNTGMFKLLDTRGREVYREEIVQSGQLALSKSLFAGSGMYIASFQSRLGLSNEKFFIR